MGLFQNEYFKTDMKYEYKPPFNAILLRYSEIGLKGNNRRMFEEKLHT